MVGVEEIVGCLLFHRWVEIVDADHSRCGKCFKEPAQYIGAKWELEFPRGYCPHSFKVCKDCGKAKGYGSHGELTVIPDGCKEQIESMGKG
jgi:hypothetical protein